MKHFVNKLINIHYLELSYGITNPKLPIVIVERLQQLIGFDIFQSQSQVHQSNCIQVLIITGLQIFQSYLFLEIHLQQLEYQTQKFCWFFGTSIQPSNIFYFYGFIDESHLIECKTFFLPISGIEYPMSCEFIKSLHRFGVVSHLLNQSIIQPANQQHLYRKNQRIMGNQHPQVSVSTTSPCLPRKESRTLLMRNPPKMHHLRSQSKHQMQSEISRKWKFCSRVNAQAKFKNIQQKMNNEQYGKCFLNINDVKFSKTNTNQNDTMFWVSAIIESPIKSMKKDIEERSMIYRNFSQSQIWSIMISLIEIAHVISIPANIAQIYVTAEGVLKLKDPQMITEIRTSKTNIGEKMDICHRDQLSVIARHIVSVALLQKKDTVIFHDINKVNLKYSTNLAATLYKILLQKNYNFTLGQAAKIIKQIKIDRDMKAESLNIFKTSFCLRKNSNLEEIYKKQHQKGHKKQNQVGNRSIYTQSLPSESSKQISQDINTSIEKQNTTQPGIHNLKRIQAINPKKINPTLKSEVTVIRQKSHSEEQEKGEGNKQNESVQSSRKTNKTSLKTSIDGRILKKSSLTLADDGIECSRGILTKNNDNSEHSGEGLKIQKQNIKKCQLFNEDQSNQSLLQSIIESEGSIIVKTSEQSPVMNLDEQIQAITRDFMKLQEQFLEQQQKEQRVSSLIDFHNALRNSTILEVTEENEETDSDQEINIGEGLKNQVSRQESSISSEEQSGEQIFTIQEYQGGSKYEGYTVNGYRHGFGKLFYEDGGSYEGNWKKGEIHGFGKLYYQSGILAYEGQWKKGEFHGEGKIFNESPQKIDGPFDYTDFSQVGTAWEWYKGSFKNDHKHGKGTLILGNGQKLIGHWEFNNVEGQCNFESLRGQVISGVWRNNLLEDRLDE